MTPTNSPRPLFPFVDITQELVITERRNKYLGKMKPDDGKHRVYMFSKLLRDLDEMCEEQIPYLNSMLEEVSDNNEEEEEQLDEEEVEPEEEYMGISFMRGNEYSWSMVRKDDVEETPQPVENSESESEPEDVAEDGAKYGYN